MNDADTIARLAIEAKNNPTQLVLADGRTFLALPPGWQQAEVTHPHAKPAPKPKFVSAAVKVQTAQSLVDYVQRFKTGNTMIFANLDNYSIEAIIDYHNTTPGEDQAEHAAHRAELKLRTSDEWNTWEQSDDVWFTQAKFARFLTENSMDAVLPSSGSSLYEIVLDLEGEGTVRVKKQMRSGHSGQGTSGAQVDKRIQTGSGDGLPSEFIVRIPVFVGRPAVDLRAFFMDEIDDGKILLGYQLSRAKQAKDDEVEKIVQEIGAITGCPVILGSSR